MSLPLRARAVIGAVCLGGTVTLGWAVAALAKGSSLHTPTLAVAAMFGAVLAVSWFWPLVLYREEHSESIHLDEGFFVVMAVVLPAPLTIVTFAVAVAIAQALRRHALVKSLFNVGQMLMAVGIGLAATFVVCQQGAHSAPLAVGGAATGALVFFVVNSVALAAIVIATGSDVRTALVEGIDMRLLLLVACVVVGSAAAVGCFYGEWAAPLAVASLLILRQVVAGHFRTRHDRVRTRGLFEATLEAHRSFGDADVTSSVVGAAATLLRCTSAGLRDAGPGEGELGALLSVDGRDQWLVVAGRSRSEPFDSSDASLLEALGAVGAGALTNASLYREGKTQRERLSAITASLGEGVCALGVDRCVTFMNPAAAAMLGYGASDALAGPEEVAPSFLAEPAMTAVTTCSTVRDYETTFDRADGSQLPVALTASPICDETGTATGAVLVFRDITERKQLEEQLAHHAFHDPLTGLANRRVFLDHLGQAVLRSGRSHETHAVLFADVDRFKLVNDSLGHHRGDELLVVIAERMAQAIRPGDLLARLGGDEFTVLLQGVEGLAEVEVVAERILEALRRPISLGDGHEVLATLSVGVALSGGQKTADEVLRDADVAMYQAKAKGRNGHYEVYDDTAMGARSAERLEFEAALRHALERDEFEVYYQPQTDISTGQMTGAEALVRWNHPTRGVVGPAEFITVAEETGLILAIGNLVLERACAQAHAWSETFDHPLKVSVNLSARQFQQPDLAHHVRAVLDRTGVDPQQVCLEITESLAMDNVERTSDVLHSLHALGISWAIDDFGTGYSSLSYLKRFPVDVVKIDRSFVDGLENSEVDTAIVAAIIGLTQTLHMTTIAEGVETVAQLAHLAELGCDIAQGFLFSRPLTVGAFDALLRSSLRRAPLSIGA